MTAYLVQRRSLSTNSYHDGAAMVFADHSFQPRHDPDAGPVMVPETVHPTRAAAEREADRLDRAARPLVNPFWVWSDPADRASLPAAAFAARLAALGLTPPTADPVRRYDSPWPAWWDAVLPGLTDAQRDAVWELLGPSARFYEVVEVELED